MDINKFIHNKESKIINNVREIVFGLEDGMVSTLGAITGIALGTSNHFTVILSGLVIIAVESISMGVGSFLSSDSEKEINERKIKEEKYEIDNFPHQEKTELLNFYKHEGWPAELAGKMANYASQNKKIILKEMLTKELKIFPKKSEPFKNGLAMFLAYIIGGFIPLFAYFLLPLPTATYLSVSLTLLGLFILGSLISKFSITFWLKSGLKMLILGSLALAAGILMSQLAQALNF